jgi:hypothetical protein
MATSELGSIQQWDIRKVWENEARDFTPWLFNNSGELAKALGFNLELHKTEHQVGRFSLDLIGQIPETKERVIIENQLEPSDHGHFGQLLTYAGGTEANYVIWIAKEFKEEYLSAIQWLNNGTTDDINFFAVEVSAVKIGDSLPAPMFKVVAQPNGWQKEGRAAATVALSGGRGQKQLEFWELVIEAINDKHPDWTNSRKGRAASWFAMPTGISNIGYDLSLTNKERKVELVFWSEDREVNAARFEALLKQRESIEESFGHKLQWHFPEDNKQAIVRYSTAANFEDEAKWASNVHWFIEQMEKLRASLHHLLPDLR